ncbi:MAG: ribosome small subunit-dependent GTPase A [Gammaproteobacteria bacterium]|nr:ribosome small subunit-dependent GTPase A [Gammaproteobacteria bacterium]
MAKRKLSRQQQRRITSTQKTKIVDVLQLDESRSRVARVISHHGRELFAEVESLDDISKEKKHEKLKCKIRQNLGEIACGDFVIVQQALNATGESQNVVVAVKDRLNLLKKTGFAGAIKPVAANIGQVVIVTSIKPKPNPYLIDRYLASTESMPAQALIVINKIELMDQETRPLVDDLTHLYRNIGYKVIATSMKHGTGLDELSDALSNTTSILVGLSGVGKSSIVKNILPKEAIKIGATSEATGEGKHTTTVSALYHLKCNGIIIDSPGVRDFTPISTSIDEITNGFIDVRKFSGVCKFSNCSHHHEPGCALKQAVADGKLSEQRFKNYLRMLQEYNEKTRAEN